MSLRRRANLRIRTYPVQAFVKRAFITLPALVILSPFFVFPRLSALKSEMENFS